MLSDQIPCVELVALKALADLDQLEGSWQSIMESSDPEGVALLLRLLLAHMASTSKRLLSAMVLDRLDAEERATASKAAGHQGLQSAAEA